MKEAREPASTWARRPSAWGLVCAAFLAVGLAWRAALPVQPLPKGEQIGPRSAILFGDAARPLFHPCSRQAPATDGFWDPTAQDIATPEAELPAFLQSAREPAALASYFRQYAGFTRGGKKMIYLNAFAQIGGDWTQDSGDMCDGGKAFFGAVYDVERHAWGEMLFNGSPP